MSGATSRSVDAPTARRCWRAWMFASTPLNEAMGLYLPATVAFRLINFGRILLLTWWMTKQQFGLLNMILLALNVLTPLCSLGLNEAVTRYVPQHETRGSLRRFVRRSFSLLAAITLLSMALLWIYAERLGVFFYAQVFTDAQWLARFRADAPDLARLSAVVIGLLIAYFYLLAVMKGLRMFNALAIMEMFHGTIFLAASIGAIAIGRLSAFTLTALYGFSLLVPVVWFGIGLARSISSGTAGEHRPAAPPASTNGDGAHATREQSDEVDDEPDWASKLLRFSVWTTLAGITWQALVYYPTWFLNKVNGHDAVAVFSAVRQIGQFILVGAVAVVTVVMTIVTRTWETRGREAAQRQLSLAFRGTGIGLLVLCTILALCRGLIIRMFQADYAPGAAVLPLHLLFFLFGAFLAFLPIHFQLMEKTRHMFWPWAIGVAANMLYAFWLAGPGLETVQSMPIWKTLSAWTTGLFVTDFSDPMGLGSAAWCGVFAIFTALVLCIVLIRAECCRLDRGTYLVIAAAGLLGMNSYILAVGIIVFLLITFRTQLIFTNDERRRVLGYVQGAFSHVPSVRQFLRWRNGG